MGKTGTTPKSASPRRPRQAVHRAPDAWLRLFADQAPVMMWLTDADGYNTYLNREWLRFRGREQVEEVRKGWRGGMHPDDLKATIAAWRTAFETRAEYANTYRLRHADGGYRYVESSGRPMFEDTGIFRGYAGISLDVTERKRAEQTLVDTQAHYRALFKESPVAKVYEDWSAVHRALADQGIADAPAFDTLVAARPDLPRQFLGLRAVLDTNDAARILIRTAPGRGPFGAVADHAGDLFVGAVRGLPDSQARATWTGTHRDAGAAEIGLQITSMISRVDDDWSVVLHTFEDQTERRAAEAESRCSGAILNAAAFAAERFLGATDWREKIDEVLRVIGEAAELSRVYIFEHITDERGAVMRQIREWAVPGVTSQIDLPVYADLVVEGNGYESWLTTFNRGEPITALARELSPMLQEELASQAILSLIGVRSSRRNGCGATSASTSATMSAAGRAPSRALWPWRRTSLAPRSSVTRHTETIR